MLRGSSVPMETGKPKGGREASFWNEQSDGSDRGVLAWWYRLAAPGEPPNASSQDRARIRAGRLGSIILMIMLCFGATQLPNALASLAVDPAFATIILVAMAINLGALILNKQGKVALAGTMMVIIVELAFFMVVLVSFRTLTSGDMPVFELLVVTELMAVSLLPPESVFLVMLCNVIFTWATVTFLPHNSTLNISTAIRYYSILASPLVLQVIVAIITYLWARGANLAIERAERVAALEHALTERDRAALEQKQQLEDGIHEILQTHIQVAKGNFDARAPLARENMLWQVAYSLNNLLTRMQRAIQSESELQRTGTEAARLVDAVRFAKMRQRPIQASRTGTLLDPLAQELHGNALTQPQQNI